MAKIKKHCRKLAQKLNSLSVVLVVGIWALVFSVNQVAGSSNTWITSEFNAHTSILDVNSVNSKQILNSNVNAFGLSESGRLLKKSKEGKSQKHSKKSKKHSKSTKERCKSFKSSKSPKVKSKKGNKSKSTKSHKAKSKKGDKSSKTKSIGKGAKVKSKKGNGKGKGSCNENPTSSPTKAPAIPTGQPTICSGLTDSDRANNILTILTELTDSATFEDDSSPQSLALDWILNIDGAQLCPDDEDAIKQRYILAVVYYSTDGDNWNFCGQNSACLDGNSYLSADDVCTWHRTTCDANNELVQKVELDQTNLGIDGSIPSEIFRLTSLQELSFDGPANLESSIPDSIGEAVSLITLDLDKNNLSGVIPSSIGSISTLEKLDIDFNKFTGIIPSEIGSISTLTDLLMGDNDYDVQPLPESFAQLENLNYLSINNANINEEIPSSYSQLTNMLGFGCSDNSLGGSIDVVTNWVSVQVLRMGNNNFSGPISANITNLEFLTALRLQNNTFTGQIPQSIGNLASLEVLNLSDNQLTGIIPDLSTLENLEVLNLSDNQLSGPIPDLSTLTNLQALKLQKNNFTGQLPSSVCLLGIDLNIDCSICNCCAAQNIACVP